MRTHTRLIPILSLAAFVTVAAAAQPSPLIFGGRAAIVHATAADDADEAVCDTGETRSNRACLVGAKRRLSPGPMASGARRR
jgi:hypothetical protein